MKILRNQLLIIPILLLFAVSCNEPFQLMEHNNYEAGKGSFSLTINGQNTGRTILPNTIQNDFAAYTLKFFIAGTATEVITVNRTNANLSAPVLLNEGIWDLQVTAYLLDEDGDLIPAAQGEQKNIEILEGKTINGNVTLMPIIDSGMGTFSWNISYPSNVTVAGMIVFSFDVTDIPTEPTHYFTGGTPLFALADSISLDSGFYRVIFRLSNNQGGIAVRSEILHIYQNMESAYEFTFTDSHFLVNPLDVILAAYDEDASQWNLQNNGITAAHFIIEGINGVYDDNFEAIANWFDNEIDSPAFNVEELKVLVDFALVDIASKDPSFKQASKYANRTVAEEAIHSLVKNGTPIEITGWQDYIIVNVRIDGQYDVSITFDGEILPPLTGLKVVSPPNKTFYLMGETISLTGLQVNNVYADGLERLTTEYGVSLPYSDEGFIRNTFFRSGIFPIIIFTNIDTSKTAAFNITVGNVLVETGLPVIYIETQDGVPINSTEIYRNMNFSITSDNPAHNVVKTGFTDEIRGRGNSTWFGPPAPPKKPYRIRFREETSLFGMVPARNWVLLANWSDRSLLRTTVAFELGMRFGLPFTCHAVHVEVVLNGEYQGSYVLTEHMRAGDGRVDLDRNNGYLVELDIWYDEDPKFRTPNLNVPVIVKLPDLGADINQSGYDFVRNSLFEFDAVMSDPNFPDNNYTDILDIDNFVDFIMINEIVFNTEIARPASIYMYKDAGDKIKMGPLWDFDGSFGGWSTAPVESRLTNLQYYFPAWNYAGFAFFFLRFFECPVFLEKYRMRWNEKLPDLIRISAFIDELYDQIKVSGSLNSRRWYGSNTTMHENSVNLLAEWWRHRVNFLHREINRTPATPDQLEGKLLILQAYGSSPTAAGVSHSFVELYNTTNSPINLNGISLYYADGTNHGSGGTPATADGAWKSIPLTGTIPARGSYMIMGPRQSPSARHQIPDNFGDINDPDFTLSNRAFKVALIRNTAPLTVQNPFDVDGNGRMIAGYIDMVGAANTYPGQDMIYGFETAPARNSASAAVRRKNLIDTNNNAGQNDGSGDFISINYSSSGISNGELSVRRPRNAREGLWNPMQNPPVLPPTPTGNKHLIFQVGAATDGNINRSFVELYNASDAPLDLSGYSLQYAEGTRGTPSATEDGLWQMVNFSQVIPDPAKRIIPPRHSFLILGGAQIPEAGVTPALTFNDGDGDLNLTGFHISNRSFKVVLMSNTTSLTVQNPFGLDGITNVSGAKVSGYVDMVGAMNTVGTDKINGFEYLPITNLNKQTGQRRTSLTDTDNNQADFARATFGGATHERLRPKNLSFGAWDPITGLKDDVLPPPPPTETERLMILQANTFGNNNNAATGSGFPRSLVELYNNANTEINLTAGNYYLHIGNATDWTHAIKLEGTIPAKSSFLIATTNTSEVNITPRAPLPVPDQEANFIIGNSGFKIAVLRNQAALSIANPFANGNFGGDYVDMFGVGNNTNGFETARAPSQGRPQVPRRISLADTDNNSVDFGVVDYRSANNGFPTADLYKVWPRNSAAGAWNPITGVPAVHPIQ